MIFVNLIIFLIIALIIIRLYCFLIRKYRSQKYLCFFHPYCNNGGGGERVLWVTILGLLQSSAESKSFVDRHGLQIVIYNGNKATKAQILDNVARKFEIEFTDEQRQRIIIVNIALTSLLEARWYPVATMVGQSLGSMLVVADSLWRFVPDVYYDTIGAPFAFPVVSLLTGARVIAYVHYPVISSDMLKRVREQRPSYNNDQRIASNLTISSLKLAYYQTFATAFTAVGNYPSLVMVNSSWTSNHIASLWRLPPTTKPSKLLPTNQPSTSSPLSKEKEKTVTGQSRELVLIYPPCNTRQLQENIVLQRPARFSLAHVTRTPLYRKEVEKALDVSCLEQRMLVMSVGQFRPEKDHLLQIEIMHEIKRRNETSSSPLSLTLLVFGSIRNEEDERYVQQLQAKIDSLALQSTVKICTNQSYDVIQFFLSIAQIGLHTMWNEHFGISVVEMMAAGLLTVAHNSGGPKEDIIDVNITGFLADSVESYVKALERIYRHYDDYRVSIQTAAREKAQTFSDELFISQTLACLERFVY